VKNRLQTIINRMAGGDVFYLGELQPRIKKMEVRQIEALVGEPLWIERIKRQPTAVYPLRIESFAEAALGVEWP
jgi:hypothetical protein